MAATKNSLRSILATAEDVLKLRDVIEQKTGVKTPAALEIAPIAEEITKLATSMIRDFEENFAHIYIDSSQRLKWDDDQAKAMIALLKKVKPHVDKLKDEYLSEEKYRWGSTSADKGNTSILKNNIVEIMHNEATLPYRNPDGSRDDPFKGLNFATVESRSR